MLDLPTSVKRVQKITLFNKAEFQKTVSIGGETNLILGHASFLRNPQDFSWIDLFFYPFRFLGFLIQKPLSQKQGFT